MISAKQAREIARPKFDKKANEAISKSLEWINTMITNAATRGHFVVRLGLADFELNEYETNQIIIRLKKRGFKVATDDNALAIIWMKGKL